MAAALGLTADEILLSALVDVGPVWYTLQLASADHVLALSPDMALMTALGNANYVGITVFGLHSTGSVRCRRSAIVCTGLWGSVGSGMRQWQRLAWRR